MALREQIAILQLVNQFAIGGAEGQFVARLRAHPRGYRPVVGCIAKSGPNLAEVEKLGLPVEEFSLRGGLLKLNTALQIVRLAALIEREGVRLVHANDFYANVLAVPAARLAGVKVIVSRFDLGHWYSRAHRVLEATASRGADAVYANAGAIRQMVIDDEGVPPERVLVVHNGIDLAAFDAARDAGLRGPAPETAAPDPVALLELGPDGRALRPTVAMIGNLYAVKGHLDLIDAIDQVRRELPSVLVLCAGEGGMRAALEQQIRARGLGDNVLLLGHRLDVPAILARAHVGCLPSHAEGLSNAVIEAMAAGLPVVATRVGGNPELVVDAFAPPEAAGAAEARSGAKPAAPNGTLVPPHDPAALARALLALLGDRERTRALGAAARKRVESELTIAALSDRTGELYRRILAGEPASGELAAAQAA